MTHSTSGKPSHESLTQTSDQLIEGTDEQPQEKLPSPKNLSKMSPKGWGILIGGVLLLAGGTWAILQMNRSPHSLETTTAQAIAVSTMTLKSQSITNTLELSGSIRPVEQATLSTRVMGRITALSLESGDRFRKGDVLASIDVMDINAQTGQAQLGVAQAQAEVFRSQASLNQLESQKLEAQSALRLAQVTQSRMSRLQAEGAVSQSVLDDANTALEQARARVAQSEAGIRQSQAAIDQTQAAVSRAELSVISSDISASYGTIIAPFDGVVVQKMAYEGEMAAPGTPLLKVENPNKLELEISVPEENLRLVRVGQSVKVQFDAVNQTINGTIQQIVPAANAQSRSFLVKIPLNNSSKLISGMFGRIALPLGANKETLLVPTKALIQRGQLQGVYVVESTEEKAIAVLRWVKTGKPQNEQIEIVSGLKTGDRIITSNIVQLSDGQPVAVR
ncbi:MAG: efflux RND transporter periplasmic adaptor subunit [Pseudanabaena sp. M57BS1SP1A06MG]|jgi:HlyD family secretion protein|nr:efflux RND transporter periplasmic adaptor subunit [Pseudanabaena sp. M53BS1SP1A06MG]MCA6581568.1 efflux RND transporter periplasmic adaptor subunit [Pseudanabaena sp. M34BS1SP1A06MG]MCA6593115.1 efflux RND transporter periplasmic adaptor subunit [Pseudanabaena sp. M38BS1SP1A06MG]MCA6601284.1 efflux RND transporter periplasmic adaptor subunit [Pseudanabaena sp. M57BS1SP1A06MG]